MRELQPSETDQWTSARCSRARLAELEQLHISGGAAGPAGPALAGPLFEPTR